MTTNNAVTIGRSRFDAIIFDLDGVITRTAQLHARAWKLMFDEYLDRRGRESNRVYAPFDIDLDYRRYVDGKARYDGVQSFLEARNIRLPWGNPQSESNEETVCGLGSRKDALFLNLLAREGAQAYESSIEFIRELRAAGFKTAIVSASKHCVQILRSIGALDLFDAKVDGIDSETLGLKGKPAPDSFLAAARLLRVAPSRAMIVEDAVAGVEAGRAGAFGLVVGVDRANQADTLRAHGADVVVTDLATLRSKIENPKMTSVHPTSPDGENRSIGDKTEAWRMSEWALVYEGFDPSREGLRESLCTLGNGYFATRGAAIHAQADGVHYPGTYLAGGYNRLISEVAGHDIEHEDLVNAPNWLTLTFRINGREWFDQRHIDLHEYRQTLDLRRGILERFVRFTDGDGHRTRFVERRLVHMAEPHLAAIEMRWSAENWSGCLEVKSVLDARIVNAGVARYRELNNRHYDTLAADACNDETIFLQVRTSQSRLEIAQAARTRFFRGEGDCLTLSPHLDRDDNYIAQRFTLDLGENETVRAEKVIALYTSRDFAIAECGLHARKSVERAAGFEALLATHALCWMQLWRRLDIELEETDLAHGQRTVLILRLHIFHLLQTASPNSVGLDAGIPARGWHGEAYRGHIFWDELFIFPALNWRVPEIARALLMYRSRRLNEARANAHAAGLRGAMYPWQSGSDGREESQLLHLNPKSGRWVRDHTFLQRHVNAAIAYNIWQYYQVTGDLEFLCFYGAEIILEIARFWASIATFNGTLNRYEILGVVGPDEFHTAYPGTGQPGVNNNAYTNLMAVWVLVRALKLLQVLPEEQSGELRERLKIQEEELERWDDVSRRMRLPFHADGIISQFEGYDALAEFPLEHYREKYGNIHRLDRILEAEGDTPNRYKVSKQADVMMLFYLFSSEELAELFGRLGYPFEYETIPRNIEYYSQRTAHGSTLSRVVHSWVLARADRSRSWEHLHEALRSDMEDTQGGTTPEGIHLGAMAGTVDLIQRCYTGIVMRGDVLWLNPSLPAHLTTIKMVVRYRGHTLDLHFSPDIVKVRARASGAMPVKIGARNNVSELNAGETVVLST